MSSLTSAQKIECQKHQVYIAYGAYYETDFLCLFGKATQNNKIKIKRPQNSIYLYYLLIFRFHEFCQDLLQLTQRQILVYSK